MLNTVKSLMKRVPLVPRAYCRVRDAYGPSRRAVVETTEAIFTDKIRRNAWCGVSSASGRGSDLEHTTEIIEQLPRLFRNLRIASILDIPCGDYYWMRRVDRGGMHYIGADIVKPLVDANRKWETPSVEFRRLDLLADDLPAVDLVFCRDCLVHFSLADVHRALDNICRSGSTYLLTTTFTDRITNIDIPTGRWRVLNLQAGPFNFPPPLRVINERCTQGDGKYADKSLGLWRIIDLCRRNASRERSGRADAPDDRNLSGGVDAF